MAKADKLYGDSPKLERDDESGKVEAKKPAKKADVGADGSHAEMGDDEMRHAHERREMHHRHVKEHLDLHHRHEMEHTHHEGDKKTLHERHEREHEEMHTRHEKELKALHDRHEKEHGAPKPAEKK